MTRYCKGSRSSRKPRPRSRAAYGDPVFCEMMADSLMFELFSRYLLMKLVYCSGFWK